ncbi:MAG TPA: hypothetical protein VJS91_10000 [Nitrososphaeraceae archaeon]|nr:hypothetical protein [Nitrososphaeraceae archaeon]
MILSNVISLELAMFLLGGLLQRSDSAYWFGRGYSLSFLGDNPLLAIVLFTIVIGGLCVMGYRLFKIFYKYK